MPTTTLFSFLNSEAVLIFLKAAILLILLFYAIFALVIIRQVDLMNKALMTNLSPVVKYFAFFHAIFAIGLIILSYVIL